MKRIALLSSAALACSLAAQSNTVAGLDGRLEILNDITYWGRNGAAYPGGQVGLSMRNTMCNPGSVSIPWYAQMQENHPKFGFLITRLSGDRMEQISDRSFCKHAFTSASTSGACGACNGIGGNQMGVTCSDTYSAGNNASQGNLGPADEINPWLGTWNAVGSYFDIGDPAQSGFPAPADGADDLNTSGFGAVKSRVTVQEVDLQVPGAQYFYGIQLVHQGEAVANRGDNIKSRGMTATWNGTGWTVGNSAVGEVFGSILQHWTGADLNSGGNGNDDGRFFVASKVTALGGGQYHYEYAVHNVDNSRGGAALRIPIDVSATASNFSFGDIDNNAANNWTAARVGNEVVFTAPLSNPLNWNTIYNFGFDANFAPGSSFVALDEARVGPGSLQVVVAAKAPSGASFAQSTSVGRGCGNLPGCPNSFYETASGFDMANSGFTITNNAGNYSLGALTGSWIAPAGTTIALADDGGSSQALPFTLNYLGGSTNSLWICSNGFVSASGTNTSWNPSSGGLLGGAPTWAGLWRDLNPAAGGTIRYDATAQRAVVTYNAVRNYNDTTTVTFQLQFWANGTVHFVYQALGGAPATVVGFSRGGGASDPGAIDISATVASSLALCNPVVAATPRVALASSARPVIGTTFNLNTTNMPTGTLLGMLILSQTQLTPGADLTGLGMPDCELYCTLEQTSSFPTPGSSASVPVTVPNLAWLSGIPVMAQTAVITPGINAFGFVTSNGLQLLLGLN